MNFKQFTEIVNTTEVNELYNAMNKFEINDSEIDNWIDDIFEHASEIDINKMPYVLDVLYRSDDKIMFMSFCMLFEATFQDLPFITRLEDIPIYKEKYKIFIETLLIVFEKSYDGIVDCLSAIILNNDPKGELLSKDQYDLLVNSINTKLALLKEYILEAEHVDEGVYGTLEMIFDLAVYINNKDTVELLKRYENVPLNNKARAFYIKAIIQNRIMDIKSSWWEALYNDLDVYNVLSRILTSIDAENVIPKKYIDTERLARSVMIDWLAYPTELGQLPKTIELVDSIEKEELIFYIYKFSSKKFENRGDMLGLSGAFVKNSITTREAGFVFSNFDSIKPDYKKQAEEIIKTVGEHWKEQLEDFQENE